MPGDVSWNFSSFFASGVSLKTSSSKMHVFAASSVGLESLDAVCFRADDSRLRGRAATSPVLRPPSGTRVRSSSVRMRTALPSPLATAAVSSLSTLSVEGGAAPAQKATAQATERGSFIGVRKHAQ